MIIIHTPTHTYPHTHTHTYPHTHTHTYPHTPTHTHSHTYNLTTFLGMSGAARRKRADKSALVKEIMKVKQMTSGVGSTVLYMKLFEEYRSKAVEKFGEGVSSQ